MIADVHIFRHKMISKSYVYVFLGNGRVFRWIVYFAESRLLATWASPSFIWSTHIRRFRMSSSTGNVCARKRMLLGEGGFGTWCFSCFWSGQHLFALQSTFASVMSWNGKCEIMTDFEKECWFCQPTSWLLRLFHKWDIFQHASLCHTIIIGCKIELCSWYRYSSI